MAGVWSQLKALEWKFPFLHNLVSGVILLFVIAVLVVLYPTIGLSIHLAGIFRILIADDAAQMRGKTTAEKIGYSVSIGAYFLFFCLFAIVSLPFHLLGLFVGAIVDSEVQKPTPKSARNSFEDELSDVWSQIKSERRFIYNFASVAILLSLIAVLVMLVRRFNRID